MPRSRSSSSSCSDTEEKLTALQAKGGGDKSKGSAALILTPEQEQEIEHFQQREAAHPQGAAGGARRPRRGHQESGHDAQDHQHHRWCRCCSPASPCCIAWWRRRMRAPARTAAERARHDPRRVAWLLAGGRGRDRLCDLAVLAAPPGARHAQPGTWCCRGWSTAVNTVTEMRLRRAMTRTPRSPRARANGASPSAAGRRSAAGCASSCSTWARSTWSRRRPACRANYAALGVEDVSSPKATGTESSLIAPGHTWVLVLGKPSGAKSGYVRVGQLSAEPARGAR